MKKTFSVLAIFALMLAPFSAHAVILYEQLTSTQDGPNTFTTFSQGFDNTLTGIVNKVTLRFRHTTSSGARDYVVQFITDNGATVYNSATTTINLSTSFQTHVFNFDVPVNLENFGSQFTGSNAGLYWQMKLEEVDAQSTPAVQGSGSSGDVFAQGRCFIVGGQCGSVSDWYFIVEGDFPNTETRIIAQNTPPNGTTTPSTTVTFDFDYFYNDTTHDLDTAGVLITNIITGATAVLEEPIVSGENSFSDSEVLMSGGQYIWQPFLASDNGLTIQNGSAQPAFQFFVETSPFPFDSNIVGTSSASSSNAYANFYSNLTQAIRNNPPFEAVFDMLDLFRDLSSTTPSVAIVLPAGFVNEILDPIRTGLQWVLTIGFGGYALHRLIKFRW